MIATHQKMEVMMSHHSESELPDERRKEFEELQQGMELGATGEFPRGKIAENDEGGIQFAIGSDKESGTIVIDFGPKPIAYVGMTPKEAIEVAQSLIKHASPPPVIPLTASPVSRLALSDGGVSHFLRQKGHAGGVSLESNVATDGAWLQWRDEPPILEFHRLLDAHHAKCVG